MATLGPLFGHPPAIVPPLPLPFGGLTGGTFYGWLVTRGPATYSTADLSVDLQVQQAGSSINRRRRVYYYPRPYWRSQLRTLFGGHYTQKSDFTAFIARFQRIIADPGSLHPEAFDFLDRCGWYPKSGDRKLDYSDLLFWLNALLKEHLPASPRLPTSGNGWSANPTNSDPLDLKNIVPSGTQTLIIDGSNTDARKCVRNTNNVQFLSGTGDGILWLSSDNSTENGSTYRSIVLSSPKDLDEGFWGTNTNTVYRFPVKPGKKVVVLIRGGAYTIDKEIQLNRNNTGFYRPDRIHIMGYPGESVTLQCGSSLIEALEPGDSYAGAYRLFYAFDSHRHAVLMENLEWVGYRDSGGDRIFAHGLVRVGTGDGLTPPTDGTPPHLRNCIFRDSRGGSSADAAAYPDWIDDKFNDRYGVTSQLSLTDLVTSGVDLKDLTSATGGFTVDMVNLYIKITSNSGNWVAGLYKVDGFTDSHTVRLLTSPTPNGADTAGVGKMHALDPKLGFVQGGSVIATVALAVNSAKFHHCLSQPIATTGPLLPESYVSEGVDAGGTNPQIEYNLVRGYSDHSMIRCLQSGPVVRYNDVSNLNHTAIGLLKNNFDVSYNRVHDYGHGHDTASQIAIGIQLAAVEAITSGTLRGNVVYNSGIHTYQPEAGMMLQAIPGSGTVMGLTIEGNLLYITALHLSIQGGWQASTMVSNCTVRKNVLIDVPTTYNTTHEFGGPGGPKGYNAPIFLQLGGTPISDLEGCKLLDNIIRRSDGGTTMLSVQTSGTPTVDFSTLSQIATTFPASTGNTGDDPLFVNPAAGDFRFLPGSPVPSYLSPETPLASLPAWNLSPLSILR